MASCRVRVYKLSVFDVWDDQGTGFLLCVYSEKHQGVCMCVRSESDEGTLILESKVRSENIYQRQGDGIITWVEPETQVNYALSFQSDHGCQEVWEQLFGLQGRGFVDELDAGSMHNERLFEEEDTTPIHLPPPDLQHLDQVLATIVHTPPSRADRLALVMANQGYIRKLLDVFGVCEDLENEDGLVSLHLIFKSLLLLNDSTIIKILLSDDYILDVMGALEWDPDILPRRVNHREAFREAIFKEVVPIRDSTIRGKIHQNFRIQYLKDVILARAMDEQVMTTLNSIAFFNNAEIVAYLENDDDFLDELFRRLKDPSGEQRRDLIAFLQEMCSLARNLQIQNRATFFRALCAHGLLDVFEFALVDKEPSVRQFCTDILISILSHDPPLLRLHILRDRPTFTLFRVIVEQLLHETDTGIKIQISDALRLLVDPETMVEFAEKDNILNLFYEKYMDPLVVPFAQEDEELLRDDEPGNTLKHLLCELLSFFVQRHGYRIKYFILRNNVVHKVLRLLRHRTKFLVLSGVRFLRACVGMKDEFYNRYIVKHTLFQPVMDAFELNGSRYNLLNSAIIELFQFILQENIKTLLAYVVEAYQPLLEKVTYVQTFRELILRHQMNVDLANVPQGSPVPDAVLEAEHEELTPDPDRKRGLDHDEEAYFDDGDDDNGGNDAVDAVAEDEPAFLRPSHTSVSVFDSDPRPCRRPPPARGSVEVILKRQRTEM